MVFFRIISAIIVYSTKIFSKIFYRTEATWIPPKEEIQWENLKLAVVLNHTSLFEFLFVSAIPNYRLWRAIKRTVLPVADTTMNRPLAGTFFKVLVPNAVAITRKRDETWFRFMERATAGDKIVLIFPEGRMKRKDGLDKYGKPMSVKGGVADILEGLTGGKMLIAYSGGLHHVQAPGEWVPRLFKTIRITFEQLDIEEYKRELMARGAPDFRSAVIADLEARMKKYC